MSSWFPSVLMLSCVIIERYQIPNHKGGCLRRPRAARRMLPAASTVRSASPASRARRGFTFGGKCQPWGFYEKRRENLNHIDSSKTSRAADQVRNLKTLPEISWASSTCSKFQRWRQMQELSRLYFWPQCEPSSNSSSCCWSLVWVQHIDIKAEIVILGFNRQAYLFGTRHCQVQTST